MISASTKKAPTQGNNKPNINEWVVFEESNIQGTISGIVKKDYTFKTLSGHIYVVDDYSIQVVVEVMPDVTVLQKGESYKLIIEGFDDPLICKRLK